MLHFVYWMYELSTKYEKEKIQSTDPTLPKCKLMQRAVNYKDKTKKERENKLE